MKYQKGFLSIAAIIITVLVIGGLGYYFIHNKEIVESEIASVPELESELVASPNFDFQKLYEIGQFLSFSNKGEEFHEKISDIKYLDNNRYIFFKTLAWDVAQYYLIDQLTNDDLLIDNKYLTSEIQSSDSVFYVEDKKTLIIKTFTNDLVGVGFNGVLIIDLTSGSVVKHEIERKDYSDSENSRITKEVSELFNMIKSGFKF